MTTTPVASEPADQTYTILDREIRLPCVVRDATAAVAFYLVPASAAQKLIAKSGLRIAQMLPGRTICTLGTMNYKDSDLGGYHEVALTFFVHEADSRPLPLISALLGMARGSLSAYVHWLPVNGDLTCEAGRRIWGFPKFVTQIDIEAEGDTERSTLTVDGERVLTLALCRLVEIIGEAANRGSQARRDRHPDIPWGGIIGLRNRLIHGY